MNVLSGWLRGSFSSNKCGQVKFRVGKKAFTLIELLVVISIIFLLMGLVFPALGFVRSKGYQIVCRSNIRQLVFANANYADENKGFFPAGSTDIFTDNLHRWYGVREDIYSPFDLTKGPLAGYADLNKISCAGRPDFAKRAPSDAEYDDGSGGFGYNLIYIGSRIWQLGYEDQACKLTAKEVEVGRPAETLMFADTAMAKQASYVEYSFAEPRFFLRDGQFETTWTPSPSIHFRHRKTASIGWADGHSSSERIARYDGLNEDGTDPTAMDLGWFEPMDNTMFDLE
jgi:prepilin-type N-terminal cleavage/methylation domain-containing protein/prepilin-type processing-associated H-X9-DG protein